MKTAEGTLLITNARMVDGTGAPAVADAAVIVKDGKITYAGPARGAPAVSEETRRIDARGGTVMPGLVEAHFHPTYFNVAELADLDIKYPVEFVTILAASSLEFIPPLPSALFSLRTSCCASSRIPTSSRCSHTATTHAAPGRPVESGSIAKRTTRRSIERSSARWPRPAGH